ncbi:DUF1501 domain-containing protein [Verrucomicrobia bacterium]|nr:DUF1501 domain-containing protein [Verrucomicrobiota bacterium]MDB4459157.1 DUF1501 domain-containing protein [bacterium]
MNSALNMTRRHFFNRSATGIGAAALGSLMNPGTNYASSKGFPNYLPKAKKVIYLFQSGGPSQLDLYDPKPHLDKVHGQEVPDSVFNGQRLTGMSSGQASFPAARSIFKFPHHGQSGTQISELMPYLGKVADDICLVRSVHTEAINHDPAITFMQTGFQIAGRPSIGSWLSYGLGSENSNIPAFVAMLSGSGGQPLYDRLWGSGFLPSRHQGVRFRSGKDPVLYLNNPDGMSADLRRKTLNDISSLNNMHAALTGDPEIQTRIAQYEMAFRMQSSVPELTEITDEPDSTFKLYGEDARKPGTYAHNALLARRMSERGVRFVQLFHRGWDQHGGLPGGISKQCKNTDQASAALITDLKQRGLLDETLVIWGGEFGRTVYCQGDLAPNKYGRDHHPRCFSMWMAGGGIKPGITYGETDDYSYNIAKDPANIHDLHATYLHLLGVHHEKLIFRFQGRDYRLTDVEGELIKPIIA